MKPTKRLPSFKFASQVLFCFATADCDPKRTISTESSLMPQRFCIPSPRPPAASPGRYGHGPLVISRHGGARGHPYGGPLSRRRRLRPLPGLHALLRRPGARAPADQAEPQPSGGHLDGDHRRRVRHGRPGGAGDRHPAGALFRPGQRLLYRKSPVLVEGGDLSGGGRPVALPHGDLHPLGHSPAQGRAASGE